MTNANKWQNMAREDMEAIAYYKKAWHDNAGNPQVQADANKSAMQIKERYGIGENDDIPLGTLQNYIAASDKRTATEQQKTGLLTRIQNTDTDARVQKSADALRNFNYDPTKDAAYKSYVDMYNRQGQSAAKQTINDIASMTMGRVNGYATAAAAQVQQAYAQKASEMIPVLADQAYNKLLQQYNVERDLANDKYNRNLELYNTFLAAEQQEANIRQADAVTEGQNIQNKVDEKYKAEDAQSTIAQRDATTAQIVEQTLGIKIDNLYKDEYWQKTFDEMDAKTSLTLAEAEGQGIINDQERVKLQYLAPTLAAELAQVNLTNEGLVTQNGIQKVVLTAQQTYGLSQAGADLLNTKLTNQLLGKEIDNYDANAANYNANAGATTKESQALYGTPSQTNPQPTATDYTATDYVETLKNSGFVQSNGNVTVMKTVIPGAAPQPVQISAEEAGQLLAQGIIDSTDNGVLYYK